MSLHWSDRRRGPSLRRQWLEEDKRVDGGRRCWNSVPMCQIGCRLLALHLAVILSSLRPLVPPATHTAPFPQIRIASFQIRLPFRTLHCIANVFLLHCVVKYRNVLYCAAWLCYNESESSLINIAFFLTHGIARYRSWSETSSLRHTFKIVCVSRLLSWKQNKTKMYPFLISFSGVLKYF